MMAILLCSRRRRNTECSSEVFDRWVHSPQKASRGVPLMLACEYYCSWWSLIHWHWPYWSKNRTTLFADWNSNALEWVCSESSSDPCLRFARDPECQWFLIYCSDWVASKVFVAVADLRREDRTAWSRLDRCLAADFHLLPYVWVSVESLRTYGWDLSNPRLDELMRHCWCPESRWRWPISELFHWTGKICLALSSARRDDRGVSWEWWMWAEDSSVWIPSELRMAAGRWWRRWRRRFLFDDHGIFRSKTERRPMS